MIPPAFEEWVKNNDILLEGCSVRRGIHGNGLYACKELAPGDVIASVPISMAITQQNIQSMAAEIPFLHNLLYRDEKGDPTSKDPGGTLHPNISIARFLMYVMLSVKKGSPDPRFGVYVQSMPPARDINLPLSWTDDELDLMKESSIYDGLLAKRAHLKLAYADLFSSQDLRQDIANYVCGTSAEKVPALSQEVSFYDYILIEQWILSRCLQLGDSRQAPATAMIPIIDIANHSCNANAYYEYEKKNGRIVLYATRGISLDEEITIDYSPTKSAAEFLYCYGFIPEEFSTARSMRVFYPILDPSYRGVLDEQYTGQENTTKSEMDLTYEYMAQFLDRPQNVFTLYDDPLRFTDEFIYLLAAAGFLKLELDEESGYYELQYGNTGRSVDLENAQEWLGNVEDAPEIQTLAEEIAGRLVRYILSKRAPLPAEPESASQSPLDAQHTSRRLILLEQKLLEKASHWK